MFKTKKYMAKKKKVKTVEFVVQDCPIMGKQIITHIVE